MPKAARIKADDPINELYDYPRYVRIFHRIFGPPVAFVVASVDGVKAGYGEFRRNYRSIRSWHADVIAKEDKDS